MMAPADRPLRVAVLVDLEWTPRAGGHVKYWERVAAAAADPALAGRLDLTVHFAAASDGEHVLAPHVRYRLHRPVFSTRRLGFLSHVPDHTDLAPRHARLAAALDGADVIHTTDAFFAFARTAAALARRRGVPLVNSVHTDTPRYTRLYTAETIRRLTGGALARVLVERLKLADGAERRMLRRLVGHQRRAAFALAPRAEDAALARSVLAAERVRFLPHGLDLDAYHPRRRDRPALARDFGVPLGATLILFAGRVDPGKNVMTLGAAVAELIRRGRNVVLFAAGDGPDRKRLEALLGERAFCPGNLPADAMPALFASADLFAHPSEIESWAIVVGEALASGTPALVSAASVCREQVRDGETGRVVTGGAEAWADALDALVQDETRRREMGRAARQAAERDLPRWRDVVERHLIPVWRAAAAGTLPP
jgi:glycosyltransferase involved in cell wall biosynthesis